jgi:hypothetical protein
MPHATLKLIPGVDRNRTEALNEAAIWDCNLIRFVPDRQGQGLPQKLGGWQKLFNTPMTAIVRALHAWADTNSNSYLAIGTASSISASRNSGQSADISPQYYDFDVAVSATTTSGSSSVTIIDTGSNVSSYDSIYISTPISVGGIVISGFYPCIQDTASPANTYRIISKNVIGSPAPATSSVTNGGAVPSFSATSGSLTITVTMANHGYSVGSTFAVLVPTSVGGVTLSGNFIVTTVPTAGTFTITAPSSPTSTQTVSMNGGLARITYYVGQVASPASGYGSSGYGYGGYGIGVLFAGGRQVSGVNVTTSSGICTAIIPGGTLVVPAGSRVIISSVTYTVISGGPGVFTFAGSLAGTGLTVTVSKWGFVMPDTSSTNDWSLDNWGEYLIASPHNGEIFYWNPGASDHLVVVPNAPLINEGAFISMPELQIVAFGSTFTGVQDPLLVRWCDIADLTDWVGTVTNQAGSFRIPKGSKIIGGMQGPQQGLLWTDIGLWSMQYVNQPLIYSFNEIGTGCGLVGRKAMGTLAGAVYWMSQSQFFYLSGGGVQVLNCPIWDIIFQNIDKTYLENVRCAPNSRFNEIAWYFPTIGSNGIPTHYVKYNTVLSQWDFGTLTRTAWIDQSIFGPPIGAGADFAIYQHEVGENDGDNAMDSYFQTGYFTLQEGDLKTFLDQLWPDMKWGSGSSEDAIVGVSFYTADYPGDTPKVSAMTGITKATQFLSPRIRARLVSIRVSSNEKNIFWRLGGIRYRFQPDGKF